MECRSTAWSLLRHSGGLPLGGLDGPVGVVHAIEPVPAVDAGLDPFVALGEHADEVALLLDAPQALHRGDRVVVADVLTAGLEAVERALDPVDHGAGPAVDRALEELAADEAAGPVRVHVDVERSRREPVRAAVARVPMGAHHEPGKPAAILLVE